VGENSAIEWTHHTFNPWIGCTKVAAGCAHCYAETLMDSRYGKAQWGPNGTRVLTSPSNWAKPLKWNRDAERAGVCARVFCASLADVFEEWPGRITDSHGDTLFVCECGNTDGAATDIEAPKCSNDCGRNMRRMTLEDVRYKLFSMIDATPNLDWLLLTKRPKNIRRMMFDPDTLNGWELRQNVWLGTSIATQEDADRNVPYLLECRDLSPVLFLSMEPLLGPVRLDAVGVGSVTGNYTNCLTGETCFPDGEVIHKGAAIDWGIVGGESGPNARPMHPDWARSIRDQCQAAGVPFHFKQFGEYLCDNIPDDFTGAHANCIDFLGRDCAISYANGERWEAHAEKSIWSKCGTYDRRWVIAHKVGKKAAGRELDGRTWDEFPKAGRP
jgi:protein gp37